MLFKQSDFSLSLSLSPLLIFLSWRPCWHTDLLLLVCQLFSDQLMLYTGLGSEDGLGPVRPQCGREHLSERGDSLPTQGIAAQWEEPPCVGGEWLICLTLSVWVPESLHPVLCVSPGLLLQCHSGGCAAAFFLDSNSHPQHTLGYSWHLRYTGYCAGPTGGL